MEYVTLTPSSVPREAHLVKLSVRESDGTEVLVTPTYLPSGLLYNNSTLLRQGYLLVGDHAFTLSPEDLREMVLLDVGMTQNRLFLGRSILERLAQPGICAEELPEGLKNLLQSEKLDAQLDLFTLST